MEFKALIREALTECKIHFFSDSGDEGRGVNLLLSGDFEEDQRYQRKRNFGRKYIISLIGLENNAYYLFAGVYKVLGVEENKVGQPFYGDCKWAYDTELQAGYDKLIGRLLVKPKTTIGQSVYRLADKIIDEIEVLELTSEPFDFSSVRKPRTIENVKLEFNHELTKALDLAPEVLIEKSRSYPVKPTSIITSVKVFNRNPYVVAQVLLQAKGICGNCKQKAPFKKRKDGTPYLEVHHIDMLANGGDDSVENCIALCPNCHRKMHYG